MPDLSVLLDRAGLRLDELLATSGTTVDLQRGPDPAGAPVDPATLAPVVEAASTYAAARPALVTELAGANDGLAARTANPGDVVVVLGRSGGDLDDVRERDVVQVGACRDPRLAGNRYVVRGVRGGSAGVALLLTASLVRS
jgi:hypothetical protein